MTPGKVLARARGLLAGGWSEPMSLNAQGFICTADDEGLDRVCVVDALAICAGGDVDAEMAAGELLEQQVRVLACEASEEQARRAGWVLPVARPGDMAWSLYRWLEQPARTHHEVLQLFARAQARALAEESRR